MSVPIIIVLFFIIANMAWINDRLFLIFAMNSGKSLWLRLFEIVVYYLVSLLIAIALEVQFSGEVYPQGWEFIVTTFCLFLVLAVPGVVYRYQWLPMQRKYK